jgi:hypothetical protein
MRKMKKLYKKTPLNINNDLNNINMNDIFSKLLYKKILGDKSEFNNIFSINNNNEKGNENNNIKNNISSHDYTHKSISHNLNKTSKYNFKLKDNSSINTELINTSFTISKSLKSKNQDSTHIKSKKNNKTKKASKQKNSKDKEIKNEEKEDKKNIYYNNRRGLSSKKYKSKIKHNLSSFRNDSCFYNKNIIVKDVFYSGYKCEVDKINVNVSSNFGKNKDSGLLFTEVNNDRNGELNKMLLNIKEKYYKCLDKRYELKSTLKTNISQIYNIKEKIKKIKRK